MPSFVTQADVAFGDSWSAAQQNTLFDNVEAGATIGINLPLSSSIAPMSGLAGASLELAESSSTDTVKPVFYQLRFDDTTDEGRMWVFRMNITPSAAPTLRVGYRMAGANVTKSVGWVARIAALTDTDANASTKVFAAANAGTVVCPNAADTYDVATITLTNADSVAKGEWCCVLLYRNAAVASDATGDAIVTDVELYYG